MCVVFVRWAFTSRRKFLCPWVWEQRGLSCLVLETRVPSPMFAPKKSSPGMARYALRLRPMASLLITTPPPHGESARALFPRYAILFTNIKFPLFFFLQKLTILCFWRGCTQCLHWNSTSPARLLWYPTTSSMVDFMWKWGCPDTSEDSLASKLNLISTCNDIFVLWYFLMNLFIQHNLLFYSEIK